MGIKDRLFSAWSRDHHKAFAEAIAKEIETKADSTDLEQKVSKSGDTLSGGLTISFPPGSGGTVYPLVFKGKYKELNSTEYTWRFAMSTVGTTFWIHYGGSSVFCFSPLFFSASNRGATLGFDKGPWGNIFVKKVNNGADIEVPNKAGTFALLSDIEDVLRKYNLIPAEEQNQ